MITETFFNRMTLKHTHTHIHTPMLFSPFWVSVFSEIFISNFSWVGETNDERKF